MEQPLADIRQPCLQILTARIEKLLQIITKNIFPINIYIINETFNINLSGT